MGWKILLQDLLSSTCLTAAVSAARPSVAFSKTLSFCCSSLALSVILLSLSLQLDRAKWAAYLTLLEGCESCTDRASAQLPAGKSRQPVCLSRQFSARPDLPAAPKNPEATSRTARQRLSAV